MSYYYLISSLPMLKADMDAPISYDEFVDMCKQYVSEHKYEVLKDLSLSSNKGPFFREWAKFYDIFKEELAYQRNTRQGKKTQVPSQKDETISKLITKAIENENPRDAENMLISAEFQLIDELVGVHYFDDYALCGYALKLKLLERKNAFKKDIGRKEFERIVDKLEEQITNMEQE